MKLTQGAIGNLINRYRAVLKKCHLLNTFGSLAVVGMLVAGAGAANATPAAIEESALSFTGDGYVTSYRFDSNNITYTVNDDGSIIISASNQTTERGVLTNLYQNTDTGDSEYVSKGIIVKDSKFINNEIEANDRGIDGAAITLWADGSTGSESVEHQVINSRFENNSVVGQGGAIAVHYQNDFDVASKPIFEGDIFVGNHADVSGGALYIETGDTVISNSVFSRNTSDGYGGAVHQDVKDGDKGSLTVSESTFNDNEGSFGGAIFNSSPDSTITGGSFTGNKATQYGGAIYNNNAAELTIDGVTFADNTAKGGAAINNSSAPKEKKSGQLSILNSTFENNVATSSQGGAIRNTGIISEILDTTFSGNRAHNGGAINNGTYGEIDLISGSTFDGNSASNEGPEGVKPASQGGAITNAGTIKKIADTKFTNNSTSGIGGAIANVTPQSSSGELAYIELENITVENNHAGEAGGGIYNDGQEMRFTGVNSIVDNTAGTDRHADDIVNAVNGSITIQEGSTTIGALDNGGTVTVGEEGSVATLTLEDRWTQGETGSITVKELSTFAVDKGIILNDQNEVIEGVAKATLDKNAVYKINNLEGGFSTEELNDIKQQLLGEGSQAILNFGNITIDDIQTNDCGHVDYAILSQYGSTSYTADVKDKENDNGIQGAFKSIHLTETADRLYAKGNLTLAGSESETMEALVMKEDGSVANLRIGSTSADDTANISSVVTLGDSTKNNKGTLGEVQMNAGVNNTAELRVLGKGDADFEIGSISADGSKNTVSVEGARLTTGSIAPYGNQTLDKLSIINGEVLTKGTARVDTVTLNDSSFTAKDTGEDGSGAITVTSVTGQGTVEADNSLTFKEDLITAEGDDLNLYAGKAENYTGTVTFAGNLDSTDGTVHIDADTLTTQGTATFVKDDVKAGQWTPSAEITATDSLIQVGQFGEEEGTSSLDKVMTLDGTTLFVHGTSPDALAQAQKAIANTEHVGTTYYAAKTLDIAAGGQLIAGEVTDATNGYAVVFGENSMLVVDGNLKEANPVFTYSGEGHDNHAFVDNTSTMYAVNVTANDEITIFGDGFAPEQVAAAWNNVQTDTPMLEGQYANNKVTFTVQDPMQVFPGLSEDLAPAVYDLYNGAYNDVEDPEQGVRFLSRATNNRYLGAKDTNAAVSTIESAARMAFAGAVPQMTRMASDAATNSVVNRMGFANPENGAKAMNVEGQLVDEKALGLALWIAPLWSNQNGFGMEAGNLDYGYNANLGGVSLGADYTWANNFRAGLMFNIGGGYAQSSGDLSDTTNSMTFWGIGAYAGWKYENFAVMGDVSYTSTWNSVDQDVDYRMGMSDLEADIQASAISAGLRGEYKFETSALDIIPHVGVRYMSINTWGYDVDNNMGTVLEGDGFQQNIWTFPVGVTFSKELEMNNDWYFKPSVDFTVIPAAGDIKAKDDVRFTGMPQSYEVETQMMDYFTWQGGVGLEFGNDNMSVGVNYTLQAGQYSTSHGVFGMFRYEF